METEIFCIFPIISFTSLTHRDKLPTDLRLHWGVPTPLG